MSNIRKFPTKKKSTSGSSSSGNFGGEVIDIEKKINETIERQLGKFVKEIQELKAKQKKLEAYQKARKEISGDKKKKKNKSDSASHKKPKK